MNRDQWDALTPKGRWDIIVAQRGPDSKAGDVLKWFTTSVIRSEVGQILRAWGGSALVNDDLKAIILPAGPPTGKKGIDGFDWSHFLEHIHSAATYLGLPIGHVSSELYYEAITERNLYAAAAMMSKEFDVAESYKPFVEFMRHRDQFLKPRYAPAGLSSSYKKKGLSDLYTSEAQLLGGAEK